MDSYQLLSLIVSFAAAGVAIFAYLNTRDRLRLDLFEKRWPTFESVNEIYRAIIRHGGLPRAHNRSGAELDAILEELNQVRQHIDEISGSKGYVKTKALFGPGYARIIEEIRDHWAWLEAFQDNQDHVREKHRRILAVVRAFEILVKEQERYFYFGDIRRRFPTPITRCFEGDRRELDRVAALLENRNGS